MAEDPTTEMMAEQPSEPCGDCGFQLASDQRYCLNCGRRRGEPRIDYAPFVQSERRATDSNPVAPAVAAPVALPPREPSPLIAVVGIALLGLMLLVGVLIGRGDGDGTELAATPQVVTVGEETTAVADAPAGEGGAADQAATAGSKADQSGGGGDAGGGGGDGGESIGPSGTGAGTTEDPAVASRDELEALENATGAEQQEASENLPDTIALPGKPPPTDNEEPGGGTDATVIE